MEPYHLDFPIQLSNLESLEASDTPFLVLYAIQCSPASFYPLHNLELRSVD